MFGYIHFVYVNQKVKCSQTVSHTNTHPRMNEYSLIICLKTQANDVIVKYIIQVFFFFGLKWASERKASFMAFAKCSKFACHYVRFENNENLQTDLHFHLACQTQRARNTMAIEKQCYIAFCITACFRAMSSSVNRFRIHGKRQWMIHTERTTQQKKTMAREEK